MMTKDGNAMTGSNDELLHAYHDGELSALARWRFERVLRRSPGLQRELDALRAMRSELQTLDLAGPAPDVWESLRPRLPAARAQARAAAADPGRGRGLIWWLAPIGVAAATAAVVLAVVYGGFFARSPAAGGTLRWIDSEGRSVMVLDDDPETTIIWVLDGATEGASRGGRSDVV
jgi:anti-sigma factor RsiW